MLEYLGNHYGKILFVVYIHYQVSALILTAYYINLGYNMPNDGPIACNGSSEMSTRLMNDYYSSHSTSTMSATCGKQVDKEASIPEINAREDEFKYYMHGDGKLMFYLLLLQSIFFYFPHLIWKSLEAIWKKAANLPPVSTSSDDDEDAERDEETSRNDKLLRAVAFCKRLGSGYAYWFCEIIAWLNIILHIHLLESLFQVEFLPLGKAVVQCLWKGGSCDNFLSLAFPHGNNRDFQKFGQVDEEEMAQTLFMLLAKLLTEKIHPFAFFWSLLFLLISCVGIIMKIVSSVIHYIRDHGFPVRLTYDVCPVTQAIEIGLYFDFGI